MKLAKSLVSALVLGLAPGCLNNVDLADAPAPADPAVLAAAPAPAPAEDPVLPTQAAATVRTPAGAGALTLQLGGSMVGKVQSFEGGQAVADAIIEKPFNSRTKKHAGPPRYEDIALTTGLNMPPELLGVVRDFLDGKVTRRDGAIVESDLRGTERRRLSFFQALITEVGFPKLDAASKDPALVSLKLTPDLTTETRAIGGRVTPPRPTKTGVALANAFRLSMRDLPLDHVRQIEAITVRRPLVEVVVGEQRGSQKEPTTIEIPNIVFTIPLGDAEPLFDWHQDFVIRGNNGEDQERDGAIDYMSPNAKDVLFTLQLVHCGILRVAPEKVEAAADQVRMAKVEMYCEDLRVK